ncbi:MAG: hypothetical protein WBH50_25820 [Fuerstiella sp.]
MKTMRSWWHSATSAALFVAAICPLIGQQVFAADLKEAIPADAFLAVYGKHNPERDYQKQHLQAVWDEVEKSRIIERSMQIIQSRMAEGDVEQMMAVRDTLFNAMKPVEWNKLANIQEIAYGQRIEGPISHHVVLARFPDGAAASLVEGITNLMNLAEGAANGNLKIEIEEFEGTTLTILRLPPGVPLSPCIGLNGDMFVFCSTPEMARQCLSLLNNPSAESKFDDPRVATALTHLPEAEDALIFFDGKALMQQLNGAVAFIQTVGAGNEDAMRVSTLFEAILTEVNVIDHEVSVEYTDGNRNLSASYGQASSGAAGTVVGKMFAKQQTFENWSNWVPEGASGFSMNSGANMQPLYAWITTKIPELFPESQQGFDRFAQMQDQFDLHLNEDLFQSFSGESVSITMPGPLTPFGQTAKSVSFMKCGNPERIDALLHRAVEALQQIPQVKAQGLTIKDSDTLEGFQEIKAGIFAMIGGMTPVYGFNDGWMTMGTHKDAVQTVMLTKGGESPSFAETETFTQFGMDVKGPVYSISYSNTGESIRQTAKGLQQVGAMLPMMIAMAGGGNNGPDLAPVQDFLQMLPSIGRIVEKFDFIDSKLNYVEPGPTEGSYLRHGVTIIKPLKTAESESSK